MKQQPIKSKRVVAQALASIFAFCLLACPPARAQSAVVDEMVASVNGRELITYTDLLWQLALQPDTPLDQPRSEDLQRALNLLIDKRLITEEAGKLPAIAAKDDDVTKAANALISRFPSQQGFQDRLQRVGLTN